MVAVPPDAPDVIAPVVGFIDTIEVLLLLQVPPDGVPVNVAVFTAQNDVVPVIEGVGLIVTIVPVGLPHAVVKWIVVVPVVRPLKSPFEAPIVATTVLLLLHVPAPARSDN